MVGLYEYFSRGISVEGAFGVCLLSLFCPQGYKALCCVQNQMWYGSLRLNSGLACSVYFTAWLSMVVLYKHFSIESHAVKYTLNAKPESRLKEPYHTWFCTQYKTLYPWGKNSDNMHPPKSPQLKGLFRNVYREPPLRVMKWSTQCMLSQN